MRVLTRLACAIALGLLGLAAVASPASAHAELVSSDPADGESLDATPANVVLTFSETIGVELGGVRVFDSDGERVDTGDLSVQDAIVTTPLQTGLGDDAYIVTYRVVSADGHPVRGALTFTVGDVAPVTGDVVSGLLGEGGDRPWEIAGEVARAIGYGGTLLAAGLAAFLVLAHDGGPEAPTLRRLLMLAAAMGAVAVLVQIPITASLATGLGFDALGETGVLGQVMGDGVAVTIAVVLTGLGVLLLVPVGRDDAVDTVPAARYVVLAAAVAATSGYAISGHTAITDPRWLVSFSDAMHATAGAVWLGGLVGVVIVLRARRDGTGDRAIAPVVARFSGVAAIALAGVASAGFGLAWSQVRTWDALTSTYYGRLLIAKVSIVAVVAVLGAWNRLRLVPALERAPKTASSDLRRTAAFEVVALLAAVSITGVLVQVTPARASITAVFSETVPLGDGSINLVVDPPRVGATSIHLYVLDGGGRPFEPEAVTLELSLPAAEIGPIEREPFVAGPGHYQLDGSDLSIAGTWTITVDVRTDRFDEESVAIEVPIRS